MKKIFMLYLSGYMLAPLYATVLTVSNDPNKPAQYSSPTAAMSAAAAGDTLYIYGSPNSYGSFDINKNVTIIGAGFNTRKDNFNKTVFNYIDMYGPRNGVTLDGIYMVNSLRIQEAGGSYSNITLRNMLIYGGISGLYGSPMACGTTFTNWLFENSYITSIYFANTGCNPISPVTSGFLVKNSIIMNMYGAVYNVTFLNCQLGVTDSYQNFGNKYSCTFNNCILTGFTYMQNSTNQNNQFNNCLTYLTQSPDPNFNLNNWTGGASGSANSCIINQNPLWVTQPSYWQFSNSTPAVRNGWNPALQAGSPAINMGSDSTDIGLTGNPVPYNPGSEPKIPVIRRYQLVNAVVPPSGTVTINATATKAQ